MRPNPTSPEPADHPRRLLSVRQVLAIGGLALVVATLLSAQWLRKNAQIQDDGPLRDVGLAVARPLADGTAATGADRPRGALKALIGRQGVDDIDTTVAFARPGARRAAPRPPPKPVFTRRRPLRVLVVGDSLAITPGESILRVATSSPVMRVAAPVDGRVATGLERPDVFNWFTHLRREMKRLRPSLVVVSFGANDDHGYMTGLPGGVTTGDFASRSWEREYSRRVAGVMDDLARDDRLVAWIGAPATRDGVQSDRFAVLNRVYRTEAAGRRRVFYVDTRRVLGRAFSEYLPNPSGRLVKVRAGDGVHYERAGADRIARQVVRGLRQRAVLRLVRARAQNAGRPPRPRAGAAPATGGSRSRP